MGAIDENGDVVVPIIYTDISFPSNGLLVCVMMRENGIC